MYRSGVAQEYTGETSTEKMLEFIASFDAPLKVLKKTSHASDFLMRYTTSIVGAFEPNTPAHTAFGLAAQKFNKGIARVESKKMARRLEIKMDSVVAFSLDDKPPRVFNGPFNTAAIQDFIVAVRDVTVQELDEKVYKMVASQGLPLAMLFYSSDDEKTLYGEMLETAAKAYRKEALYFRVDANKVFFDNVVCDSCRELGVAVGVAGVCYHAREQKVPYAPRIQPDSRDNRQVSESICAERARAYY